MSKIIIEVTKHYGEDDFKELMQNLIYEKLLQVSIKDGIQQNIKDTTTIHYYEKKR